MAEPLDLFDVLSRLRARWRVWLVAALAGAAIGAGVSAMRPVHYVAETHLLVEAPPDASGVYVMTSPAYLDAIRTYAALANGATVRSRALAALSDGHREAAGAIEAEAPSLSRLVVIKSSARDPESALAFARAAAEQTIRMVEAARADAQSGQRETVLLVDPGVLPERPADRKILVNALAASFFALLAAAVYEGSRLLAVQSLSNA